MNYFSTISNDDITWEQLYYCTQKIISTDFEAFDFKLITIPTNNKDRNNIIDWLPTKVVNDLLSKDKSDTYIHYFNYNYGISSCKSNVYYATLKKLINTNEDSEQAILILYFAYLCYIGSSKATILPYKVHQSLLKVICQELQKTDLQPYYSGNAKYTLPYSFTPFLADISTSCQLSIELFFKIVIRDIYELSQSHRIIKFVYSE